MIKIDKNSTQEYKHLPHDDTRLWRYMSIPKFLSLIQSGSLYFNRADMFKDIYEGAFTQGSLDKHIKEWGSVKNYDLVSLIERIPRYSFVSCWHMSKYESAALWEIYGSVDGSIAIETSMKSLKSAFPNATNINKESVITQEIAKVQYIDYKTEHPYLNDLTGTLCYKRQAYSYEKEIRVIIMKLPKSPKPEQPDTSRIDIGIPLKNKGLMVPIDLNTLIESVYLSPSSPKYIKITINDIMKKYGLTAECIQSSLDELPEFGSLAT